MKRWLPVLVVAAVLVVAVVVGSTGDDGPPTANERVARIAREVRCPTCESLSAADSDAPSSEAIREQIKVKVEAGQSDDDVRAYLVDRYGKDILLRPDATGLASLVWVLPVAGGVAAAAGLAAVFVRWRRRRRVVSVSDGDRALVASVSSASADDEELAFLLTSLADLEREREAGDIDDADYVALRDDYTARAAARLRGAPVETSPRRSWKPVAVALGVVAAAGLAGVAVARTAGERVPGQELTGGITETPNEKLARAASLAGQGKLLDAIKAYDEVIKEDPQNAEALAYRGWLVRLAGRQGGDANLIDRGLEFVDRAIAADPGYPDARFFRGVILLRDKNDPAGAIPEFEAFINGGGAPEMRDLVQKELDEAKAAAARP